jgi:hypothetical protein
MYPCAVAEIYGRAQDGSVWEQIWVQDRWNDVEVEKLRWPYYCKMADHFVMWKRIWEYEAENCIELY